MGTFIWKQRVCDSVQCAVNSIAYGLSTGSDTAKIESAIDNLPVFNPSTPGTYTFVDFTSGNQQKEIEICSTYTQVHIKNNYDVPVSVRVYLCIPREDTSISPLSAIQDGLTDVGSGLTTTTPMLAPYDSPQFNDLWKVAKCKKRQLKAGQEMFMSHVVGSFQYDPSFVDNHGLSNQGRYGGHQYLIRVEGPVGHDTTADEQGRLQGGIDFQRTTKYVIKYEAGADIKYIEIDDDNSSFTNGGIVSTMDVEKEGFAVN